MKKKCAIAFAILMVGISAAGVWFSINYNWSPPLVGNQFNATAQVNSTTEAVAYAKLPTTQVGETAATIYKNQWFQTYLSSLEDVVGALAANLTSPSPYEAI